MQLNEGLEELGEYKYENNDFIRFNGVFSCSGLQQVVIPSTLQTLGTTTFCWCNNLKSVILAEGSQLERIGANCFSGTGIEEFLAPPSLRAIGDGAFSDCKNLERVVLNEGLETLEGHIHRDRDEDGDLYTKYVGIFQSSGL